MSSLKRSALGRGLDSLISMDDIQTGGSSAINEIELSQILPNPEQPRTWFDEESLEEQGRSGTVSDYFGRTPFPCRQAGRTFKCSGIYPYGERQRADRNGAHRKYPA